MGSSGLPRISFLSLGWVRRTGSDKRERAAAKPEQVLKQLDWVRAVGSPEKG